MFSTLADMDPSNHWSASTTRIIHRNNFTIEEESFFEKEEDDMIIRGLINTVIWALTIWSDFVGAYLQAISNLFRVQNISCNHEFSWIPFVAPKRIRAKYQFLANMYLFWTSIYTRISDVQSKTPDYRVGMRHSPDFGERLSCRNYGHSHPAIVLQLSPPTTDIYI